MTRKFTFLLMALLALAGFKSWGQETITVDFESGIPSGWTTIDADGDGNNWTLTTEYSSSGSYSVVSESYRQVLYPDNFLVSPQLTIGTGANISFWAYSYSNFPEKIGVAVSTTGNSASDFTVIKSWTYGSGEFNTNGKILTADLSEYAGQQVYLAIRHYDVHDQWKIFIDDITINLGLLGTQYNIAYDNANIEHGSITGPATAYSGQPVKVTATPDAGYALEHIMVNGEDFEGNTFTMPENDVTVSATFVYHPTLTVNDGTATNEYIPVYGFYCDASNQQNQFIIPAEQLAEMLGGTISGMTFYLSSPASGPWNCTWTVKLMETTETTISSLIDVSSATSVYTGVLNGQSSTMEVPFTTTSYVYNGGNLLVDFSYSGKGSYKQAFFYGVSASANSSYCHYNSNNSPQAFLPKTTFDYTPNPNLHHITVNQPAEGGTISAPAAAISGDVVTLTATPELGYAFGEWITDPTVEIIDNQFVMPSSDVTITATFSTVTMYAITFTGIDETIISVAAKYNGETITEAQEGIEVTLEHTMLSDEYGFKNWIVNGETLTGNTFTMPADAVEIGVSLAELETLTVYDGTNTNSYVPIYGYWADGPCNSQFIMPSADLEIMRGGTISSMSFYLNHSDFAYTGTWTVYLKEVDYTTLSDYINWTTLGDGVYTGHMTIAGNKMTVNFDTPFVYNEGNLLIGFNETVAGNSSSTSWYGVNQTVNTAFAGYRTTNSSYQFLPKTTFAFIPDPNRHSVTVNQPVGGTIAASPMAGILPGTSVTLTATPNFGYEFDAWIVKDADEQDVDVTETEGVYTFEMPASDVTVTATFNALQQYDITFVDIDETIITVSATAGGNAITEAPAGTEVTLQYSNLDEGYTFINWTFNGVALAGNTFEMPANDVEIGVALNERPRYAVIIDGSIAHGTVTASPNENILGGKTVTLTVTPADSYVLNTLTVTDADSNPVAVSNNQFTMPESNVTVTATFSPVLTLTVNDGTATNSSVPFEGYHIDGYLTKSQFIISASDLENMAGGTITDLTFYLSGTQNKELPAASWEIYLKEVNTTEQGYDFIDYESMTKVYTGKLSIVNYQVKIHLDTPYQYNAASENPHLMVGFKQTAKGSGTWATTNWHGAEDGSGIMRSRRYGSDGNASYNFLPKTTFTYSNPNLHGITVNQPTEGGEIAASAGAALPGTIITLTATPELGYEFGEWIVSPSTVTITGNTFEMPASDVTVTATFNEVTQYGITFVGIDETLITVAATFGGETITEAPAGTEVTLEYSNLNIGYTFGNWTLNGEALAGNTFTMPAADVEVGVVLNERPRFAVTIDEAITNGTITAEPSSEILGGTLVTLTITPETGYTLDVLTVTDAESNPVAVTNNTFTMPESNVTVTATFVHGITVYDGTVTNQYTAVYTYYGDTDNSAAQFVVPAEQLTAMVGGEISSIKFYVDPNNITNLTNLGGPSYAGYITEVTETTMSSFIDFGSATTVFTGHVSLSNNNSELVIDFSAPYTYNGGNLAIAFECTAKAGYTTLNYYGTTVSGGGIYRNSGTGVTINNFIPKTTFLYTPVTPYTVNLHVNGVVSEEEVSSLPTPENIPAGMTFCGWTNSDIATYTTEAPSYVTKATADGEDFYAVFSYTESEPAASKDGETWEKVTDASDLQAGDEIVLVYNNMIMCTREDASYMDYPVADVTITDNQITSLPTNAAQFTLVANGDYWNLQYEELSATRTLAANANYEELASQDLFESWSYTALVDFEAQTYNNSVIFKNADLDYYIGYYSEWNQITLWTSTYACAAYKKSIPMITTTYYMTEVLTSGEVTDLTTNNIIVASPITVSGRLEMNEGGLFRNENTVNFVFANGAEFYYTGEETVLATFQKSITGYTSTNDHYYLIANPTNNETVANLVNEEGYDLYTFDGAADLEWINMKSSPVVANDGMGYLYANSSNVTLGFAGEIIPAGSTDINLNYANKEFGGFNLIGNPFACNAYANGENFYKIAGTELSVSTGTVAPCEGIFVQATAAGQIVTLTTEAPVAAPNALCLTISQNRGEAIDRAIVRFDECNDLHKFMLNPAHTNIRLAKHGEEFAAISSEAEGEIPVSFKAEKNGSYTITVNTENVNAHYIHLIDNKTGMDVDLLATPNYTFNASTSDYAYRFKLVFSMTGVEENESNANSYAYINNGNLVIDHIEGEATMQIVDMLGRVVSTEIVSGSYNKALNLKAGLYIINLNGMTQKIVVK